MYFVLTDKLITLICNVINYYKVYNLFVRKAVDWFDH